MPFQTQTFLHATNIPQNFPELLALYKEKETESKIDLTAEIDYRTRPGVEMRKNGAIQALPGLRAELMRMIEQNAGAIFLNGTQKGVEEFIGKAQDLTEGAIVIVSAKEMYVELAKYIDRGIRTDRRFSMDTINAFVDGVMRILDKLNVEGIPAPNLVPNLNREFPTLLDVEGLARRALQSIQSPNNTPVGDGLNAIYVQLRASEEIIKEGVATPFLPVIVIDATPAEVEGPLFETVFFGRNVVFEAKDEVSEIDVVTTLNKLKKQYKSRGVRQNKNA